MGHYYKLYKRIKNNPKNVRFDDIDKLLTKVGGFTRRNNGSTHYIYTHPDLNEITDLVNIPFRRPVVLEVYIKNALEKFEKANPDLIEKWN